MENPNKAGLALRQTLREEAGSRFGQNLLKYLDFRIAVLRKLNDTASIAEVKFNQGAIAALSDIKFELYELR